MKQSLRQVFGYYDLQIIVSKEIQVVIKVYSFMGILFMKNKQFPRLKPGNLSQAQNKYRNFLLTLGSRRLAEHRYNKTTAQMFFLLLFNGRILILIIQPQTRIFLSLYSCNSILTVKSVRSNNSNLIYLNFKFKIGCKDIGIRIVEFVTKTQFLYEFI